MRYTMILIRLVLLSMLVTGCGKGKDASQQNDEALGATTDADNAVTQTENARDACTLITAEEVAAIYGSKVVLGKSESEGSIYSSCEYVDPAHENIFVLGIDVYWRGGRDQWRAMQLGTAGGVRMLEHA